MRAFESRRQRAERWKAAEASLGARLAGQPNGTPLQQVPVVATSNPHYHRIGKWGVDASFYRPVECAATAVESWSPS